MSSYKKSAPTSIFHELEFESVTKLFIFNNIIYDNKELNYIFWQNKEFGKIRENLPSLALSFMFFILPSFQPSFIHLFLPFLHNFFLFFFCESTIVRLVKGKKAGHKQPERIQIHWSQNLIYHGSIPRNCDQERAETTWCQKWSPNQIQVVLKTKKIYIFFYKRKK
jgi:hypothetical protein